MATKEVIVNWLPGTAGPEADPDEVPVTEKDTKIRWVPGANVASVDDIGGLPDDEFTQQGQIGNGKYQVVDKNSIKKDYPYTIHATQAGGGSGSQDPKIRNGG